MKVNDATWCYCKYKKYAVILDLCSPPILSAIGFFLLFLLKGKVFPDLANDTTVIVIMTSISSLPSLAYIRLTKNYAEKMQEDADFNEYELLARRLVNVKKKLDNANKKIKSISDINHGKYKSHRKKTDKLIRYVSCNLSKEHREKILEIISETDENVFSFLEIDTSEHFDVNDDVSSEENDDDINKRKLTSDDIDRLIINDF